MNINLKNEKINILAEYLKVDESKIKQFDDMDNYFEIINKDWTNGYNIYTDEEREKYARIYEKQNMKEDERFEYYEHLQKATGLTTEELKNMFVPDNHKENVTLSNGEVYIFLKERNLVEKYIDIILADNGFDYYKEALSPSLYTGEKFKDFWIYQWC